jgi:hypothetical protein
MEILQQNDNLKRWRMMLGGDDADGTGVGLSGKDAQMDAALGALYEFERKQKFEYKNPDEASKKGGTEGSNPNVARWLGDIHKYFPQSVVQVIQNDALKQPELKYWRKQHPMCISWRR